MLRLALPLLLAAACTPVYEDDIYTAVPDAPLCGVGDFAIRSPVTGEHYAAGVDVHVGSHELDPDVDVAWTMVDDTGHSFAWTSFHDEPSDRPDDVLYRATVFHYDLAPGHRYELTGSRVCPAQSQTVTFFTSAD